MVSSGLLRRVALVRIDVSEEPGASFIRVTNIGELGTTQAAIPIPIIGIFSQRTSVAS
jgi:putative N-acetylmannosamine-6-phosphate epimerase